MHPRFVLQGIKSYGRPAERWAIQSVLWAVMSGALLGAAFGQTAPAPALSFVFTDPVAGARCLAGEGCSSSAAPAAAAPLACIAEQTIKTMPPALQAEALALSRSKLAEDCRVAAAALAREREKIRDFYERTPQAPLPNDFIKATQDYTATCLSPKMEFNHGPVTPADRSFLREHTGLIMRRENPDWLGPQPICQAARLGRFIVTAQNCIPPEARASANPGDYIADIAFRFFDHPIIYGLTLHQLGAGGDAREEPQHDYAILEIAQTPFLDEDVASLLGSMQLFDDFMMATTNVTVMLTRGIQSGATLDFNSVAYMRMNTLCRPAYIAPDGLFLHGCQIESVLSNGAPLFQRRNGRLVFVGMHSGDTVSLKDPTLAACAPGLNKYGIAIPPSILREAFTK